MHARLFFLGAGLAICFLMGCGPSEPPTYEVSGTVTWNGAALSQGDITLEAVDGDAAPGAGKIVNGEFEFRVTAGKKVVRIFAERETGKADPVMHGSWREQYLPDRYNSQSKLEEEVKPGKNRFAFALTEE